MKKRGLILLFIIAVLIMAYGISAGLEHTKGEFVKLNERISELPEKPDLLADQCELSDTSEVDLYLQPKEVIVNFYGLLMMKEYESAISLIEPKQMMGYFYKRGEGVKEYQQRLLEFGNKITKNNTLIDIRIGKINELVDGKIEITTTLVFKDKEITKKIKLKEEQTPGGDKTGVIVTTIQDLLDY